MDEFAFPFLLKETPASVSWYSMLSFNLGRNRAALAVIFLTVLEACSSPSTQSVDPSSPSLPHPLQSPKTVSTTDLLFGDEEITDYVNHHVRTSSGFAFSKWPAEEGEPIYYAVSGLPREQRLIFATIVAEFSQRTKVPVLPYRMGDGPGKKKAQIRLLFNYVKNIADLQNIPVLNRLFCKPNFPCEDSTSTIRRTWRLRVIDPETQRKAIGNYAMARALDPSLSKNEKAAIFVKDILQAFVGRTGVEDIVRESIVSVNSKPVVANGPEYSWRVPILDLVFLNALYDPDIKTGINIVEARKLIIEKMNRDLQTPRKVIPKSTYILRPRQ